jgi:hypothetical protein
MNIPQKDTTHMIYNILSNINNLVDDMQYMLETILKYNYFQLDSLFYELNVGLAVRVSTFAIVAKSYIHCLEHNQFPKLLIKYQIMGYLNSLMIHSLFFTPEDHILTTC